MPKIISPFTGTDPTAQILENLGKSLFGGNTAANAVTRAQQRKLEIGNFSTEEAIRLLQLGDTNSGQLHGAAFGSRPGGFTEVVGANLARSKETRLGDEFDQNLAHLIDTAAKTEAGKNSRFNKELEDVLVDGVPTLMRRGEAAGQRPVISETDQLGTLLGQNFKNLDSLNVEQQEALGAQPSAAPRARMFRTQDGQVGRSRDDLTNLITGEPVPDDAIFGSIQDTAEGFEGTELAKRRADLLDRRAAVASMVNQSSRLDSLLSQTDAAASVGWLGTGARVINDVAAQAEAAFTLAGGESPAGLLDAAKYEDTLRGMGIENAKIKSAILDLAYTIAASREPGGKLSEPDIRRALDTLGGSLKDPVAMRAILQEATSRAVENYQIYEKTMRDNYGDALNISDAQFGGAPEAETDEAPPPGWIPHPSGEPGFFIQQ